MQKDIEDKYEDYFFMDSDECIYLINTLEYRDYKKKDYAQIPENNFRTINKIVLHKEDSDRNFSLTRVTHNIKKAMKGTKKNSYNTDKSWGIHIYCVFCNMDSMTKVKYEFYSRDSLFELIKFTGTNKGLGEGLGKQEAGVKQF